MRAAPVLGVGGDHGIVHLRVCVGNVLHADVGNIDCGRVDYGAVHDAWSAPASPGSKAVLLPRAHPWPEENVLIGFVTWVFGKTEFYERLNAAFRCRLLSVRALRIVSRPFRHSFRR
jgi:hypothetical protein